MTTAALRVQPRTPAPTGVREAAERLGIIFILLRQQVTAFGDWILPEYQNTSGFHTVLLQVYGSDMQRTREANRLGQPYESMFMRYRRDYAAVIPKVERAALGWATKALAKEEVLLGTFSIRLRSQPGLDVQLHKISLRITKRAAGLAEIAKEEFAAFGAKLASRRDDGPRPGEVAAVQRKVERRQIAAAFRTERANLERGDEKDAFDLLTVLYAHPKGHEIVVAYSRSPEEGTQLADALVLEAQGAALEFRLELQADPIKVWRYPVLVAGGVAELGLMMPGMQQFAVALAPVLGKGKADEPLLFAGIVLFGLAIVFSGGTAALVLAAADVAVAVAGTTATYVRERQQELAATASGFREKDERFAEPTGYTGTALSAAGAMLSVFALLKHATATRQLLDAADPARVRAAQPSDAPAQAKSQVPKQADGRGLNDRGLDDRPDPGTSNRLDRISEAASATVSPPGPVAAAQGKTATRTPAARGARAAEESGQNIDRPALNSASAASSSVSTGAAKKPATAEVDSAKAPSDKGTADKAISARGTNSASTSVPPAPPPRVAGTVGRAPHVPSGDPRTASGGIELINSRMIRMTDPATNTTSEFRHLVIAGTAHPNGLTTSKSLFRNSWPADEVKPKAIAHYQKGHIFPSQWGDEAYEGFMWTPPAFNQQLQTRLENVVAGISERTRAPIKVRITAIAYPKGTGGVNSRHVLKELRYEFQTPDGRFIVEANIAPPPSGEYSIGDPRQIQ